MGSAEDIRPAAGTILDVDPVLVRELLKQHSVTEGVAVVGLRGYVNAFPGASQQPGQNLIGKYDDVLCLVTPDGVRAFLGNTDPTSLITQRAVLQPGRYRYQRGIHGITREKGKQYPAWVQAGPVTIRRMQAGGTMSAELSGQWIGCNIHKGSWTTTGSAACQTVVPEKWDEFDGVLESALRAAAQQQFWYVLREV